MSSENEPLLTPAEREELEARVDRFHAALQKGGSVDWKPYFLDLYEPLKTAVLHEMIVIDIGHQWGIGRRPMLEDYVRRFPNLGPVANLPRTMIAEELQCRQKTGERITEDDLSERFPDRVAELLPLLKPLTPVPQPRSATPIPGPAELPSLSKDLSVAQQYQLVRVLGSGQFGEVWLALKMPSGIEVAVKIVSKPADREEAQRELRAVELIKNLRHPYLLKTEDFWVQENRLHIAMELADDTLRGVLKKYKARGAVGIPVQELLTYITQSAQALDFLHSQQVTHRDVKPDNILLQNGIAKVADFGLARQHDRVMASMSFAGTPAYMAPEIWGGEGGPASDQYSLAFVYVELRQGSPALKPAPFAEMMFAHQEGRYTFDGAIMSDPEQAVLRRAMSKDPSDRFPTCKQFTEALAEAIGFPGYVKPSQGSSTAFNPIREPASTVTESLTQMGQSHAEQPTVRPTAPLTHPLSPKKPGSGRSMTLPGIKKRKPPALLPIMLFAGFLLVIITGIGLVIAGVFSPSGTASNEPNEPVIPQTTTSQTMPSTTTTPTHDPNLSKPVLPPRAKPAPQAQLVTLADGRKLYDRIVVDAAKTTIFFRLITQAGAMSRPPFYIMEHKVWAGLYREGTREAGISPTMTPAEHDDEPALGMTAIAAEEFARLILNGALPSPEEWDAAAGWENQGGRSGPNLPSAKIAVDRERPARVNRDQANGDDVTPLGLRDLCGNGREFTDTLATTPRRKFTIEDNDQALVILRGRNYTLATPLDYSHLAIQQTQPQTQFLRTPSRYTGFRVVLRLP